MKLSDSLRRTAVSVCDGEPFDTGRPEHLMGVYMTAFGEQQLESGQAAEIQEIAIECVTADVVAHGLIKGSVIQRVADGQTFRVKRLERNENGFTTVRLLVP